MVYDWIFASTQFALETKWNCGDNDLYLYVIFILNDLAMLWSTIGFIQVYGLCWQPHVVEFWLGLMQAYDSYWKLHVCGSYLQHPFGKC